MSVKSISDKLKAVALSGAITVSSLTGAFTAEDAQAQQAANTSQPAASATTAQKAPESKYPAIESMFSQNLSKKFWHDGITFSALMSDMAKKGSIPKALPILYDTKLPPEAIRLLDAPVSGTAMDIHGFAKYVKHMAHNGPPLIKGGSNIPRVIIGVVTPADTLNVQPGWRKHMATVAEVSRSASQEFVKDYGSLAHEVVRIVPSDNDKFYSKVRKVEFELKEGDIILTAGGMFVHSPTGGKSEVSSKTTALSSDYADLRLGLELLFRQGKHIMPVSETINHVDKSLECVEAIARLKVFEHTAEGKQVAAAKAASGKSGSAGSATTEIFPGCEM